MKRKMPWDEHVDVDLSSDESSSPALNGDIDVKPEINQSSNDMAIDQHAIDKKPEGVTFRRAKMYQAYMKQIPVPTRRGSVIPFTTWMGLGKSIKQLYGQPLHYLTNILLRKWDQSRFGSEDEHRPLDSIMDPRKAEANIWLMEEVHRRTTSYHYVAKLWLSDPMHHAFVDPIFPKL